MISGQVMHVSISKHQKLDKHIHYNALLTGQYSVENKPYCMKWGWKTVAFTEKVNMKRKYHVASEGGCY